MSVLIASAPSHTSIELISTLSHRFIVTLPQTTNNVKEEEEEDKEVPKNILMEFQVEEGKNHYQIGTKSTSIHPILSNLSDVIIPLGNTHTTHMSAKFKSLYPFKLTRFYDDNSQEGVYQGTISLGQENTVATYEGHVFFFVLSSDLENEKKKIKKTLRLFSFTMRKDKYLYVLFPQREEEKALVPVELMSDVEKEIAFNQVLHLFLSLFPEFFLCFSPFLLSLHSFSYFASLLSFFCCLLKALLCIYLGVF